MLGLLPQRATHYDQLSEIPEGNEAGDCDKAKLAINFL